MKQRLYWPWITALILWSVAPMLWQLLTSFTTSDALVSSGRPWTERWTLIHYKELLQGDPPFWRYLFNSTLVAGGTTLITLCLAIPGAYGLSKLPSRLRRSLRMLIAAAALFSLRVAVSRPARAGQTAGLGEQPPADHHPLCSAVDAPGTAADGGF